MQLGHGSVGFQLSLQSAYAEIAFRAERKAGRYAVNGHQILFC